MDNITLLDKLVKIKEGGGVLDTDTEQCFVWEQGGLATRSKMTHEVSKEPDIM